MPDNPESNYKNLFEYLSQATGIDEHDWQLACQFATKWKVSIADACADLNFVTEQDLAKAFSVVMELPYVSETELMPDFSGVDQETFEDLINSGAIPLADGRLAICNPYDDHRGFLPRHFCDMDMVITERRAIFRALRTRQ